MTDRLNKYNNINEITLWNHGRYSCTLTIKGGGGSDLNVQLLMAPNLSPILCNFWTWRDNFTLQMNIKTLIIEDSKDESWRKTAVKTRYYMNMVGISIGKAVCLLSVFNPGYSKEYMLTLLSLWATSMAHLNIPNTVKIHCKWTISASRRRRKYDLKDVTSFQIVAVVKLKFKLSRLYTNLMKFSSVKLTE